MRAMQSSTRGSVDELTQAYQRLIDKRNQIKADSLADTLTSFNKSFDGVDIFENGREQFQKDIIETILEAIDNGTSGQDLWASWTGDAQNAATDVYKSAGYDVGFWGGLNDYFEQAKKDSGILRAYYEQIVSRIWVSMSNVQASVLGILSTSDVYGDLSSEAKTLVTTFVSNIDSDFVSAFAQQKNGAVALREWINSSIISPLEGFDFSAIVNAKQMFESSEISLEEYRRYYGEFVGDIAKIGLDSNALNPSHLRSNPARVISFRMYATS